MFGFREDIVGLSAQILLVSHLRTSCDMWLVVELIIVPVTFVVTIVLLGIWDDFNAGAIVLGFTLIAFMVGSALLLLRFALQQEQDAGVGVAAKRRQRAPLPPLVGVTSARLVAGKVADDVPDAKMDRGGARAVEPVAPKSAVVLPISDSAPVTSPTSSREEPDAIPH